MEPVTIKIKEFVIDDFVIDHNLLKRGGQACVLKGNHRIHGDVAIKRYFHGYCYEEATLLLENIYHQNIVQFIGILINKESKCIGYIMPYMPMGSLGDVIHDHTKKYDQEQVKSWIKQICSGLSYLHSRELIHRDIKPCNVLLGKSYDDVKLSDFGTARSIQDLTHSLTTGQGSTYYKAPEILKSESYSISVDIYSLSITIWEILHRKIPFYHITSEIELLSKISNGERPKLSNDLSQEVSDMLKRCWDADASQRPTIDNVLEFFKNAESLLTTSENVIKSVPAKQRKRKKHLEKKISSKIKKPQTKQDEIIQDLKMIENNLEKEAIILLGGIHDSVRLDSLLILQNEEKRWKQLNIKLPYPLDSHGAQFINNNLYIFGGRKAKHDSLNSTYKLSERLQWEKMADMNDKRFAISNSSVILNSQIWVIGGQNENGALKSGEIYNPEVDKWMYMKEMNECRYQAAAAVVNEKIFCCGGSDGLGLLHSAECYDPSSNLWTLICYMPRATAGCGAIAMGENLVVMGGMASWGYLNTVWVLDLTDKDADWIDKPCMPFPGSFFSVAKVGGKIFICGGEGEDGTSDNVKVFDGQMWRDGLKLTIPQSFAPAVVIPVEFSAYSKNLAASSEALDVSNNGKKFKIKKSLKKQSYNIEVPTTNSNYLEKETILVLGGWYGEKRFDTMLVLQTNDERWKQLHINLPYGICNHGAQFLNNHIYIFGGENIKEETLKLTYKLGESLKWDKMAEMNEKRYGISRSNVILNDQIWVLGGRNDEKPLKSIETYNPVNNKWNFMREMNECRAESGATVINGKIFCCGGLDGCICLHSAEYYDPSSDIWTPICPMPRVNLGCGAVGMDGNLIVIGGSTGSETFDYVWALDTMDENAEWIVKLSMPTKRSMFAIAKADGKVFVCGGQVENKLLDDVKMFDGQVWKSGPELTFPLQEAAAIAIPMNFAECLKSAPPTLTRKNEEISETQKTLTKSNEAIQTLKMMEYIQEQSTIVLLGGCYGNSILDSLLILQNEEKRWKQLNIKLPYPLDSHGAQFINNNLYIFGGRKTKDNISNSTYKLSERLQWEKMADMNGKRAGISNSSVILNTQIWAIGGRNENGALKSGEIYSPETNKWMYMREMNKCRSFAAAAVVNEKIFCCGGSDGRVCLNSTECYDPSSDLWTLICHMPRATTGCDAIAMGENLVVMGGLIDSEDYLSSVWLLNTTDGNAQWIHNPSMSLSRCYFATAKIDNQIFVCGGVMQEGSRTVFLDAVEIFNGQIWKNGPSLTTPRILASAITIPMDFAKNLK